MTQRELARRTGIAQPTIARIETGRADPMLSTVERLLTACGSRLRVEVEPGYGVDRTQMRELLKLTPAERIELLRRDAAALVAFDRAMSATFDPLAALRALNEAGVDFVLIGGVAARVHGSPSMTRDVGVCHARDAANLERLSLALQRLHARLRGVDEDVPFLLDARTLAAGANFTFVTDEGDVDILAMPSGVAGFEELTRNATELDLGGVLVRVCALGDLIKMKRAAARPKDLAEVEILEALRAEIAEGPDPTADG